ncbi:MAG: restriction endonuclease subunit S [Methylococcales bacterium]|nr:restriction endonuclease subunit S [Methylococcales bacterium]MDD5633249.1 restriction endonuclease subunit S [Methylococcales bacterium]
MISEKQKLKDVCVKITKGTTPSTYGFPFVESGINYVKAESILEGGGILPNTFAFVDEATHEYLKRSILYDKDILISIAGAKLGKCGFLTEQYLPANTNQAVGIVRVNPERVDPKFIYYNFVSAHTYQIINSLNSQAAQPNLNLGQLGELEFSIPPLPTQRKIASILSAYDDLIENNLKRIKLLEEQSFLKYKGIVSSEKLKAVQLKDVAVVNESSFKANSNIDKLLYVDIASVSTDSIDNKTEYDLKEAPGRSKRILKHEDIIWSCVRPNRKSYAFVWKPEDNLIASTGFAVITSKEIPSTFLYQLTIVNEFVSYLENHAKGATYPAVTATDFAEALINIPSDSIMKEYHEAVYPCFELKNILQKQNIKLREARDILLPKLMNGQIAV